MSTTRISIEDAQARLDEIVGQLAPGEEVLIIKDKQPVAKLVSHHRPLEQPRQPGSAKGILVIHEEDENHLQGFEPYMP